MAGTSIYTVEYNGKVFDVEGPEGATPEQVQTFVEQSGQGAAEPAQAQQPSQPQGEVQFADEAPAQPVSRMSAEDEAQITSMIRSGADAAQVQAFANSKGFQFPNAGEVIAAYDKNGQINPNAAYELPKVETTTGGALARGVAQGATLGFSDELQGVAGGMQSALNGGSFGDGYNQALDEARAKLGSDEADHYFASLSGNIIGGLVLPVGLERAGITASTRAVGVAAGRGALRSGATLEEARAIAGRAVTRRMAAEGAAYGGVAGAGTSEGDLGDRASSAAFGAAAGGAGGAALGAVGNAFGAQAVERAAARRAEPLTEAQRVAGAAERQGVDVLPADVAGPTTRRLTAAAAQAPISAAPVINQGQRALEQSQAVRDRTAAAIGNALNPEAAGERATAGANAFIARTSTRGRQLYDAAEQAANGVTVTPTRALQVLNRNIAELRDTPGGAAPIERLEGLREALQNNDFTVPGVRRMRSVLRDEFLSDGIRGSDLERRVNQVVDAAAEDVSNSLTQANRPGVARQFQLADRYWRNRIRTIDDHIAPIIGKNGDLSGEQVVGKLETAAKGNNQRFVGFLNALPADEQADVRASLISRLGRAKSGAQNDTGDAFSLQTFLTNWNDVGETAKARLFGGEGRAALNDLATIASGARETAGYANRSNTSGGIWGNLGVLFGAGAASPPAAIGALVVQYGGGRLLASPRFARWLTRPPANPAGLPAYAERLTRIARAEPAIANDVLSLQARLRDAFTSAPTRMAAQEPANGVRETEGNEAQQQRQAEGAQP